MLGYPIRTFATLVESFQAERGALVHVSVTYLQGDPVYFVLFRKSDWDLWRTTTVSLDTLNKVGCELPSYMRLEVTEPGTVVHAVDIQGVYSVQAMHCSSQRNLAFVNGSLSVVNPSLGPRLQHLELGQARTPTVYGGLMWLYAVMAGGYAVGITMYRRAVVAFQWAFAVCLVLQLVSMALNVAYYVELGKHGDANANISDVASAFSHGVFLCTLMLISLGWKITRDTLPLRQGLVVCLVFGLYHFVAFLNAICDNAAKSCATYLLGEYVVRSIVMLVIIVAVNFNITSLRVQLSDTTWMPSTPAMYTNVTMLQQFRYAFLVNLILPTAAIVVDVSVISWRSQWLSLLMKETVTAFVYLLFWLVLRPRLFDGHALVAAVLDREAAKAAMHRTAAQHLRVQ